MQFMLIKHIIIMQLVNMVQGIEVEGGGEKKGKEGILVGIEGILGNEEAGNGGRLREGSVGKMEGSDGRVGIVGKGGTLP